MNETSNADSMLGFTASAFDFAVEALTFSKVKVKTEKLPAKPTAMPVALIKAGSLRLTSSGKCISDVSFEDTTIATSTFAVVQFTLMFTISISLAPNPIVADEGFNKSTDGKPIIAKERTASNNNFFNCNFSPILLYTIAHAI